MKPQDISSSTAGWGQSPAEDLSSASPPLARDFFLGSGSTRLVSSHLGAHLERELPGTILVGHTPSRGGRWLPGEGLWLQEAPAFLPPHCRLLQLPSCCLPSGTPSPVSTCFRPHPKVTFVPLPQAPWPLQCTPTPPTVPTSPLNPQIVDQALSSPQTKLASSPRHLLVT